MKYSVFEEVKIEEEETREIFFKLEESHDSCVHVIVVARGGKVLPGGYLLAIDNEGVHFCEGIGRGLGLPLDAKGKLINCG